MIRLLSVSDHMELPEFHGVILAVLGWNGDLGYIVRVHGQEFNSFRRATKSEVSSRTETPSAGKVLVRLRHPAHVGVGSARSRYSGRHGKRPLARLRGRAWCGATGVLRRSDGISIDVETAKRQCSQVLLRSSARSSSDRSKVRNWRIWLGGETEQSSDEQSLAASIFFCQPSHSALPDHVHRFDSLNCAPGALKRTIAFG